jgi:hypothetical protein
LKILLNQQKVKFILLKQWKKGRKTRRRGDGEKICGQGSMSKDGGRAMQLLMVGHHFDRVDAWYGGPIWSNIIHFSTT